jgi:hypothetical protein
MMFLLMSAGWKHQWINRVSSGFVITSLFFMFMLSMLVAAVCNIGQIWFIWGPLCNRRRRKLVVIFISLLRRYFVASSGRFPL